MPYSALTIAKYFLSIPDEDSGELISNLKLQKLLYYAQGQHLALSEDKSPLFNDKVYAWKHGPVVKKVYNHYAHRGREALPVERTPTHIDNDTIFLLDEVYRVYGRFSAWALREMTHREAPWRKNYDPDALDVEIPIEDMRSFFEAKNAEASA